MCRENNTFYVDLFDALSKLFPDADEKITPEEATTKNLDKLPKILSETDKGKVPPQLIFFYRRT